MLSVERADARCGAQGWEGFRASRSMSSFSARGTTTPVLRPNPRTARSLGRSRRPPAISASPGQRRWEAPPATCSVRYPRTNLPRLPKPSTLPVHPSKRCVRRVADRTGDRRATSPMRLRPVSQRHRPTTVEPVASRTLTTMTRTLRLTPAAAGLGAAASAAVLASDRPTNQVAIRRGHRNCHRRRSRRGDLVEIINLVEATAAVGQGVAALRQASLILVKQRPKTSQSRVRGSRL